jgi:hypothetical protein
MAGTPKNALTLQELQVIREEFAKADVNKDNVLSLQEFQALLGSNLVFYSTFLLCSRHYFLISY